MTDTHDPAAEELLDAEFARVLAMDAFFDLDEQMRGRGAVYQLLSAAREEALSALGALVTADAESPKTIRDLQWRVTRYDDLCRWATGIIEAGKQAQDDLNEEQQADMRRELRGEPSKD